MLSTVWKPASRTRPACSPTRAASSTEAAFTRPRISDARAARSSPSGVSTFMVLQGAESETLYDIAGDRLVEIGERHRPTGSVSGAAPPDDIHRVRNTGDGVAITLHVYGADLSIGTSVRRTYLAQ